MILTEETEVRKSEVTPGALLYQTRCAKSGLALCNFCNGQYTCILVRCQYAVDPEARFVFYHLDQKVITSAQSLLVH